MVPAHVRWSQRLADDSGEKLSGEKLSGEKLFALIWDALADLLGTATAAVLVRRAARRAMDASPELAELEVSIKKLEYHYTVPKSWTEGAGDPPPALRRLVGELLALLVELTGRIAIHRLERIPQLRGLGLLAPEPTETKP